MDPGNTELIEQKYKNLREQIEKSTESIVEMEQKQAGLKEVDTKGYEKLTREIITSKGKLDQLNREVKALDDSKAPKNLKEDIEDIKESSQETKGSLSDWGDSFKALLGAGAIGGVIAGVSQVKDVFGDLVKESMELSKTKATIKYSMNIDNESVEAVHGAIKNVEAYGLDGQEALQGVRKQFLLNRDASNEANENIVKMAGYLATAWGSLDFTEIIQESSEIASQFEIGQEEALGMVDALLKIGFPSEQLDIISEYGNQLKMAGYDAEGIQAIFKAGIETGSWNIDKLLDGVKEGRIKLTEFAREIPESLKPAIKTIGMTEGEFKSLAKEVASGGDKGKKAYEKIASAVLDVDDKTEQANAGTQIWGTLWEENGTAVAETIANASGEAVTMKGNVDNLNKSIAGIDDEPLIKYNKAMNKLNETSMPLKTGLANMASTLLGAFNAWTEGTTTGMKDLEKSLSDFLKSGTDNAAAYGLFIQETALGQMVVTNSITGGTRQMTDEEVKMWKERKDAAETNMEAIATVQEEKLSTMRLNHKEETDEMAATTTVNLSAMETAIQKYATTSETDLGKAKDKIGALAEKYNLSEEEVISVLENWEGSIEDFDKAHGDALARAEEAVNRYTSTATNGFEKLNQNETISWKQYVKNMESNRKAQENWWKNLKILNAAGIDDAIIAEWEAAGPENAAQLQRWVDELYKGSEKQDAAYDELSKSQKKNIDSMNETFRKSTESAAQIADESINDADWPGKGERMIRETAESMVNTIPELKSAARTGANAAVNVMDDEFSKVPGKVEGEMKEARRSVRSQLGYMRDDMAAMKWKIPRPTIPKFSLKGSLSLQNGTVPRIQTTWYANGGYADKATLLGMGEAGGEGIVPLEGRHMYPFADAVAQRMVNSKEDHRTVDINISINGSEHLENDQEFLGKVKAVILKEVSDGNRTIPNRTSLIPL
ncbi:hypothetical protein DSECCO2_569260 [anaerobic digester metagenome]